LTARLAAIPGIEGVAHSTTPPLSGSVWETVVNVRTPQGEIKAESNRSTVSAGYFTVMQTPLIAGRDFDDRDMVSSPKVAVVNEVFARSILGEPRPLGRRFADGADTFEVVGVVANSKSYTMREDFRPIAYTPASQVAQPGLTIRFVVRTSTGMAATMSSVRRTVNEFDPVASMRFATLDEMTTDSMQLERLMAGLSGFFGVIAVVLAAVGVYGVVAYTASTRRRDIGIRLALGASGAHVIRVVLGRTAAVVALGLLVGFALALPATTMAKALLFGVDAREPWLMASIALVLGGTGILAALVPTHHALHTDPVSALRLE
jgi:ABC-type antimicrobial peptide transport system permease subunit